MTKSFTSKNVSFTKKTFQTKTLFYSARVSQKYVKDDDMTWAKQFKLWRIPTLVGNVALVCVLTRCAT